MIGDPRKFAAEVGEFWRGSTQQQRVDLWAAGCRLTCDDNTVYVPQFIASVQATVCWLRSPCDLSLPIPCLSAAETHRHLLKVDDGSREQFWFFLWGPTTDNVLAHIFRVDGTFVLTFEFWRATHHKPDEIGHIFSVELPETEFLDVLDQMLKELALGQAA